MNTEHAGRQQFGTVLEVGKKLNKLYKIMVFLDIAVVTKDDRLVNQVEYLFATVITGSNSFGYFAYLCIMGPEFETNMFRFSTVNT